MNMLSQLPILPLDLELIILLCGLKKKLASCVRIGNGSMGHVFQMDHAVGLLDGSIGRSDLWSRVILSDPLPYLAHIINPE